MGVTKAAKFLNFKAPEVVFFGAHELPNQAISSLYHRQNNLIVFNDDWLLASDEFEILASAFHESRHAYQFDSIKKKKNESQETLDLWEKEFEGYISPTDTLDVVQDSPYLRQSIEIDAIAFAHFLLFKLFDLKTVIPEPIKEAVLARVASYK